MVSACLLGQKVRYDGEHQRDEWLIRVLGRYVEWLPVCPEVEMGLGVPRDTLRLIGRAGSSHPRMFVRRTGRDLTARAERVALKLLERYADVDGAILKSGSPSCGLRRVKIYSSEDCFRRNGKGLFAAKLRSVLPGIAWADERELARPDARLLFLLRIFSNAAFRLGFLKTKPSGAKRGLERLRAFVPSGLRSGR